MKHYLTLLLISTCCIAVGQNPINKELPFGSEVLLQPWFQEFGQADSVRGKVSQQDFFDCWKYYLKDMPFLDGLDHEGMYLPEIKHQEIVEVDSIGYYPTHKKNSWILRSFMKEGKVEPGGVSLYSYRLPNMGVYEVYYLSQYTSDEHCSIRLQNNNHEGCCTGSDFQCDADGVLFLYDRDDQSLKVIRIFYFLKGDGGTRYWRYFYISGDSTIQLFQGINYGLGGSWSNKKVLDAKYEISILDNGEVDIEQQKVKN